jgi:hypothetical protein
VSRQAPQELVLRPLRAVLNEVLWICERFPSNLQLAVAVLVLRPEKGASRKEFSIAGASGASEIGSFRRLLTRGLASLGEYPGSSYISRAARGRARPTSSSAIRIPAGHMTGASY